MGGTARRFRALVISGEIADDADDADKERAARRRLVATTGRCPCGATLSLPDKLTPGTLTIVAVEHEPGCPAVDEAIP
jgi:hypothetical protein